MVFLRQRWRLILVFTTLSFFACGAGFVLWAGSEIASPSRRALMDYHLEYLANPAAHGLRIDRFTASDGTPCLLCSPAGSPGERGLKIRKQLTELRFAVPSFGTIRGSLVLVHGRKGRKEDYLSIAERFCACGFRCVIPDLPAHGEHPGGTATYGVREAELPARVLNEASKRFGFAKQPAGLMGMSMGGSVAIHAAALPDSPWKALVVVSSFDSFPPVIEGQAAGYAGDALGPVLLEAVNTIYQNKTGIPLDRIQPHQRAAMIRVPTLVAHGGADRVIPLTAGRRLFDSLPAGTGRKWVEIPGADHDNVFVTDFPIYATIAGWMIRHVTAQ